MMIVRIVSDSAPGAVSSYDHSDGKRIKLTCHDVMEFLKT